MPTLTQATMTKITSPRPGASDSTRARLSRNAQPTAKWSATYTRMETPDGCVASTQQDALDAVWSAAQWDARVLQRPPAFEVRTMRIASGTGRGAIAAPPAGAAVFSVELRDYARPGQARRGASTAQAAPPAVRRVDIRRVEAALRDTAEVKGPR